MHKKATRWSFILFCKYYCRNSFLTKTLFETSSKIVSSKVLIYKFFQIPFKNRSSREEPHIPISCMWVENTLRMLSGAASIRNQCLRILNRNIEILIFPRKIIFSSRYPVGSIAPDRNSSPLHFNCWIPNLWGDNLIKLVVYHSFWHFIVKQKTNFQRLLNDPLFQPWQSAHPFAYVFKKLAYL